MKRAKVLIWALLAVVAAASCNRPKIISDETLADIFHDAFLTNAYIENKNLRLDSLKIYEPIFQKYDCTAEDVYLTIGNFSKRKSARLGDVVERAITRLEAEGKHYNREVAILDTVNNVAERTFTRTLRRDTLLKVYRLKDTTLTSITLDARPGEYVVNVEYLVDSLDKNTDGLKSELWLEKSDSTQCNRSTVNLYRKYKDNYTRRLQADTSHRRLRIELMRFKHKRRRERPHVTFTKLEVIYKPLISEAVDSLYIEQLGIRIFDEDFFSRHEPKKDSLASAVE